MNDETYTFDQARVRLDEIASQVRRKDTSLEKSLDLLEEGVRLANICTEQIDQTQWKAAVEAPDEAVPCEESAAAADSPNDLPGEDTGAARADASEESDPDPEA